MGYSSDPSMEIIQASVRRIKLALIRTIKNRMISKETTDYSRMLCMDILEL